ncbi:MAG: GHMP kinase [Chloroflexi bacterium]|nr:GHMP kinase [Chloroflexota bacterium]
MIIVQTPLRVSFLGGGTDFEDFYLNHGGAVLSTAIDKYAFVVMKERFDDMIYVNYSKKEIVSNVDDLEHELVREAMKMAGVEKGVEISTFVDVREGTGLGSSSSITVGLLQSLYAYKGEAETAGTLARQACQIEVDILGKPMGRQDQYIAAYGNMRFITFSREGISAEKVVLSKEGKTKLSERLMLFFTKRTRRSGEILAEQKANIAERVEVLKEMTKLAYQGREAITRETFDELGEMLHKGWQLKRQLASKISNSDLDEMYQAALNSGAVGGKITGAGGGGFLLLYAPAQRRDDIRSALWGLEEIPLRFEADGTKVIFDYRRS